MRELTDEEKVSIPYGVYCYTHLGMYMNADGLPCRRIKPCPFGYNNELDVWDCTLMDGLNGDEDFDPCLADQCKCCGINEPEEADGK